MLTQRKLAVFQKFVLLNKMDKLLEKYYSPANILDQFS